MGAPPRGGGPTLVLLPGMDGTGALFSGFRAALDRRVETIVVSYPPNRDIGYAGLEALACSQLPHDRPFVLLGESFSGPIAISIAAARPPGLCGLILVCSSARNPRPLLAPLRPLLRFLPIRGVPIGLLAWPALGRFATQRLRGQIGRVLAQVPSPVIRTRLRAVLECDVSALLP